MKEILYQMFDHRNLTRAQAREVLLNISDGKYNDCQLSAFMTVFLMRSITTEELSGFRDALLERRVAVDLDASQAIDIVGTGGDREKYVQHIDCDVFRGGRGGIPRDQARELRSQFGQRGFQCPRSARGAFYRRHRPPAPQFRPKRGVLPPRAVFQPGAQERGQRAAGAGRADVFQYAGTAGQSGDAPPSVARGVQPQAAPPVPLHLPAERHRLYDRPFAGRLRRSIAHLGRKSRFAVGGKRLYAGELGFPTHDPCELWGGETVEQAARIFDAVLEGTASPGQSDCVQANAAFAIRTLDPALSWEEARAKARESLESGQAAERFRCFVELNR